MLSETTKHRACLEVIVIAEKKKCRSLYNQTQWGFPKVASLSVSVSLKR